MSTQEYLETNDDIPQDIRDELEISNRLKDKQALHESVVIPKYFSPKLGKVHVNHFKNQFYLDPNGIKKP